ncbi:hypothetical protein [Bradyrhizobium guangdongense]
MLPQDPEAYLKARIERQRARSEVTEEMLRRSQDVLAKALKALAMPVRVVWHPEPPKE